MKMAIYYSDIFAHQKEVHFKSVPEELALAQNIPIVKIKICDLKAS